MKNYTHLVFDIDGTLLDTEKAVTHSLQRALKEIGIDRKMEELRFALGITGRDATAHLKLKNPEAFLERWDFLFQDFLDEITIFEGMPAILETLRRSSLQLGVITSKTHVELAQDFEAMGLRPYFDIIVTADESSTHKPQPGPMLKYLELSGADARQTLYIGDAEVDMECARRAGCDCALALWGRHDTGHLKADWYLKSPQEILQFLPTTE